MNHPPFQLDDDLFLFGAEVCPITEDRDFQVKLKKAPGPLGARRLFKFWRRMPYQYLF